MILFEYFQRKGKRTLKLLKFHYIAFEPINHLLKRDYQTDKTLMWKCRTTDWSESEKWNEQKRNISATAPTMKHGFVFKIHAKLRFIIWCWSDFTFLLVLFLLIHYLFSEFCSILHFMCGRSPHFSFFFLYVYVSQRQFIYGVFLYYFKGFLTQILLE